MRSESFDGGRYWAFISYSRKDAQTAKRLHKALESYRIPSDLVGRPGREEPVPERLFPVFRDQEEFELSSDLGQSIEKALRASRYLIVLCSPHSANSKWVNEEIKYFKSLGREDRILALILSGEPNSSENPERSSAECFPPALRFEVDDEGILTKNRTEPIGGDLRPGGDGWNLCLLKAVAGMTGMGLNAFARREKKRQFRRRLAGTLVLLFLALAGFWIWDYNRVKVQFFANVGSRWSAPEGIGKLSAEQRSGRSTFYRFEFQRYKVRRVCRTNHAGIFKDNDEEFYTSQQEIYYREDGSVEKIDLRDRNNQLRVRKLFSEIKDESGKKNCFVEFRQEHQDAPLTLDSGAGSLLIGLNTDSGQRSEISVHHVTFGPNGLVKEVMYMNAWRANRANASGIFGQRYDYQQCCLPTQITYLGPDRNVRPDKSGVASVRLQQSPLGDYVREEYLNADANRHRNTWFVSIVKTKRDKFGNFHEETYFDENDKPALRRGTEYHRATVELDQHGNQLAWSFFASDGSPTLDSDKVHRILYSYNADGMVTGKCYFGLDDKPVLNDRVHGISSIRDETGNEIERSHFDKNKNRTLNSSGYFRLKRKLDLNGNTIEQSFFGTDDQPVINSAIGAHLVKYEYNARRQLISFSYFDRQGNPTLNEDGYHRVSQFHDHRGNLTEWSYFGRDQNPVLAKDLYHRYLRKFDERGNIVEEAFFNAQGQPTLGKNKFHRQLIQIDENGNSTSRSYFGVHGERVNHIQGYHRAIFGFDATGNQISSTYFGTDGKTTSTGKGYHQAQLEYDARSNLVNKISYFDKEQQPTVSRNGVHQIAREFDDRGNLLKEFYFDEKQRRIIRDGSSGKYHLMQKTWDDLNRVTSESFYDEKGQPCLHRRGYHRSETKFDSRGNKIEVAYYGSGQKPCLINSGFHRVTNEFDDNDRVTIKSYFGIRNEPVLHADQKIHRREFMYDDRGNLISRSDFGLQNEPQINHEGFHRIEKAFDSRDRVISKSFYGTDQSPKTLKRSSTHITRNTYDNQGNITSTSHFGTNSKPVLNGDGYHRIETIFDQRRRATSFRYFGLDGQPILKKEGIHEIRQLHDDQDRVIELAYFGVNQEPVVNWQRKRHRYTVEYDDLNFTESYSVFDASNEPALSENGFHKRVSRFNRVGKLVEVSYFGMKNEPVLGRKLAIHKLVRKFDDVGNFIEASYWGTENEPVLSKDSKIHKRTARYDERGRRIEDSVYGIKDQPILSLSHAWQTKLKYDNRSNLIELAYFGLDGKPTNGPSGVHRETREYDEHDRRIASKFYDRHQKPAFLNNLYHKEIN